MRPVLIIEVTSPRTRTNDLGKKVKQFAREGVSHYVIANAEQGKGKRRRLKLLAYRLEGEVAAQNGRVWLEPVSLWLGVKLNSPTGGDRLALFDPETMTEIGDHTAISQALQSAESEVQAAKKQATAATKQAQAATERAKAEANARAAADAQVRELEEKLRRLQDQD